MSIFIYMRIFQLDTVFQNIGWKQTKKEERKRKKNEKKKQQPGCMQMNNNASFPIRHSDWAEHDGNTAQNFQDMFGGLRFVNVSLKRKKVFNTARMIHYMFAAFILHPMFFFLASCQRSMSQLRPDIV